MPRRGVGEGVRSCLTVRAVPGVPNARARGVCYEVSWCHIMSIDVSDLFKQHLLGRTALPKSCKGRHVCVWNFRECAEAGVVDVLIHCRELSAFGAKRDHSMITPAFVRGMGCDRYGL